jgi:flagellar hook-associated protein 2
MTTASSATSATSTTRITGLATGMDTDSMVKAMVSADQTKLDQLNQKQQKDTWMSDAYRQWNSDLFSFNTTTLFNMKMTSSYNTFNVSSSQSSSVTGTATANAIAGSYNVQVKQTAQAATFTSSNVVLDPTKALSDPAQGSRALTTNPSVQFTVYNQQDPSKAQTASINFSSSDTINDVVNKINSAKDANGQSLGLQAFYDQNLQQFVLRTKSTGSAEKIDLSANNSNPDALNFLTKTLGIGASTSVSGNNAISNVTISSAVNDTLTIDGGSGPINLTLTAGTYTPQDMVKEINNEISKSTLTNVTAALDATGKIVFNSTAAQGTVSTINVSGSALTSLGFTSPSATNSGLVSSGKNADIVFNGTEVTSLTSNSATLMGVNFTFNSPTLDSSGNPTTSTVTVSQNIDAEVKNIEDFVSKYNDMLGKLNSAMNEPVYSDYQPLTDAQKSAMTDTQVTQWEAKAKSGLMHGDSILSTLVNKMRSDVTNPVDNGSQYNSLASIGISSKSYQDQGKLYVDEDTLRTALQNDPDGVKSLFSTLGNPSSTNGVISRLSDDMNNAISSLTSKAGMTGNSYYDQSFIGKQLTDLQTQITAQTKKLNDKENLYYKQFAAMESAVSKYNDQGSYLSQLFSTSGQ